MNSDLVGPREAASILGIHRTTLDRWTQDGTIPSARLGGKRYYSRAQLIAAITPPPTAPQKNEVAV